MAYVHMQRVHKCRSVMEYTTRFGTRSPLHGRNLAPFLMFLLIGVLSAHFCESAEVAAESNEGDRVPDLKVELYLPGAYAESETGDESFSTRKVKAVLPQEGNSVRHSQGKKIERMNVAKPNQVSGLRKERNDLVTSEQGLIRHAGPQREMLESDGVELSVHDAVRAFQNGANNPEKLAGVGRSGRRMLQKHREWHETRMNDVIHGKQQGGSSSQRRELLLTAANHTALSPTPPMGWNPWNFVGCGDWNETLFYQTASFLNTSGMASLGYKYVNIDDCWMADARDSQGNLTWNTTRFPSGLPALTSYVHSLGLKLGLYLCAGTMTCGLKPGSLNYESRDISLVSSWGIDLVKVDNCYDEDIIPETRYTRFTDAIAATGRQILFMMCNWGEYIPARFASPISNTWRTTYDLKNSYGFMLNMSDWNDLTHAYAGPTTGWNDPDMLQIGNGNMTLDEQYTHMTLWAIMKAPLLIGTNLLNMTNETAALLTNPEVLRINQDPLGIQGFKRTTEQGKEVWAGVLSGGAIAVALVNRNAGPANITLQWANVNLTSDTGVRIRDVWARSYVTGLFSSYYTASVNGHGAKLFVLQPAVQIAVNKTANASAVYADQLPDFGNDANVRTFWQSTNGPFQVGNPYWQVDLGQPSPISSLELVARQDADETSARANYQFRCSNSSNGSNYTVIASQGSVPKEPYSTFAAAVPGTSVCRYVRVAKMDGTAFSFAELRLYKSENVVTVS